MTEEIRLWKIEQEEKLIEYQRTRLDLEARLEEWLAQDISMLYPDLLVIGRQIETDFGGLIDLLCIDEAGDLVIVELKRDKTPREVTSQALDYASWVNELSGTEVISLGNKYFGKDGAFEEKFKQRFDTDLPEILNESHRMLIVASEIDPASERIIRYLSENYGVGVNAVTFQYFKGTNSDEFLARVFLIEPSQADYQTRTKRSSKRRPNLTYEELEEIAERKGVIQLYSELVHNLGKSFQKHTTRSSIGFTGNFDGSRRTVLSLIPEQSSADEGLYFQIYFSRFLDLFKLTEEEALSLLPENREPWVYYAGAGPDYSGFAGYFQSDGEVRRFLGGLG